MAADIRVIATDLDGTLIGSANELPLYTDFRDQIDGLREGNGAIWVACTGRSHRSFREFFRPMQRMGLMPDYVILRHALIYRRTRFGFIPHLVWNVSILLKLRRESVESSAAIDQWHESLTAGAIGVATIRRAKNRLGLRFESVESAAVAADMLNKRVASYRHLKLFVYGTDLEVRMIPATKGLALSELCAFLDIDRNQVLAIGDGQNDISMLDGSAAGMVGCPANADAEVVELVHHQGGHVAPHRTLRGVMDVIGAYQENRVCNHLPASWTPVRPQSNPARQRKRGRTAALRRPKSHPYMFATIAYIGVLVFAWFDLLPFSAWIRKPMDWLIQGLVFLVSWW